MPGKKTSKKIKNGDVAAVRIKQPDYVVRFLNTYKRSEYEKNGDKGRMSTILNEAITLLERYHNDPEALTSKPASQPQQAAPKQQYTTLKEIESATDLSFAEKLELANELQLAGEGGKKESAEHQSEPEPSKPNMFQNFKQTRYMREKR